MATYAFRTVGGDLIASYPEFGKPVPVHAQTPAAAMAVEAVKRAGRAKRRIGDIVTDHGNPPFVPYDGDPVTKSARTLVQLAEKHGMRTNIIEQSTACVVEGIHIEQGVAFRCRYERGSVKGGAWYEKRARYTLIDDPRPVGVNKLTRTGLAGKRPLGVGQTRLAILASPVGVPCNVTEIERRIREIDNGD